jgi:hypothetical protein
VVDHVSPLSDFLLVISLFLNANCFSFGICDK